MKSNVSKPTEKQTNWVFKINCRDCDSVYIGQTSRQLSTPIDEHRLASKRQPRIPIELKRLEEN